MTTRYVYGVPPTNSDMDNADGLTGWIDDLCLDELWVTPCFQL